MIARNLVEALNSREQEEVLEEILKAREVRLKSVAVILETAYAKQELQQLALQVGYGYEECEQEHVSPIDLTDGEQS